MSSGEVTVIVGPVGSGKSELCEEWFRDAVDRYAAEGSPFPVWMHAYELNEVSIESALSDHVSPRELGQLGVAIVIDGLDEIDGAGASWILAQSHVLVSKYDRCLVLLASRPGVLAEVPEPVNWDGLTSEDAERLIEAVAGSTGETWGWNPSLVDAIRWPFFAIAAGLAIADGNTPTGQAELMDQIVRRAFRKSSSASPALQSSEDFGLLVRLAVSHARDGVGNDDLTFPERQRVLRSTLTRSRTDGTIEFTLPIFQQWFAASAVLKSPDLVAEALSSPTAFDRWRWTLALAGIAANIQQLDDLLEGALRANPGAGSWLLDRISDGHSWFRAEESPLIDPNLAPERLLRATRTWIDTTGELATRAYPIDDAGPITLGVRVYGNNVSMGWLNEKAEHDRVIPLPKEVDPWSRNNGPWRAVRSGAISEGKEWPWILSLEWLKRSVLPLLNEDPFLGPSDGVWRLESRYRALRHVTDSESSFFPPIPRGAALARVNDLLSYAEDPSTTAYQFGRKYVRGDELVDLAAWLERLDSDLIERPVPAPDFKGVEGSSWIWDSYSGQCLQEFYAVALGLACTAYDELAETTFSRFSWSLGTLAGGEFGVLADLSYVSVKDDDHVTTIQRTRVPMPLLQEAKFELGSRALVAPNGRSLVTLSDKNGSSRSWLYEFVNEKRDGVLGMKRSNPFSALLSYSSSRIMETRMNRPASSLASRWMFDDLNRLGFADGTFPQLND